MFGDSDVDGTVGLIIYNLGVTHSLTFSTLLASFVYFAPQKNNFFHLLTPTSENKAFPFRESILATADISQSISDVMS